MNSILMKFIVLFIIFGFPQISFAQTTKIRLIELENSDPIAFRKVTFLPSGNFFSSNIDGEIIFSDSMLVKDNQIMISGFALNDTIIDTKKILNITELRLFVKDKLLEPIEIKASRLRTVKVGDFSKDVVDEVKARKLVSIDKQYDQKLHDIKYGVGVDVPKGKEVYLSKVVFHVGSATKGNQSKINFRILGNFENSNFTDFKIYDTKNFIDLVHEPLYKIIEKSGWNEIIFDNPIQIPTKLKKVFLVLDLLEESDSFSISYHLHKGKNIKSAFYSPPNRIYIGQLSNGSYHAFYLEFLTN